MIYQFDEVESLYLMSGSGFDLTVIIVGKTMKEVAWFVATETGTDGIGYEYGNTFCFEKI